MHGGTNSLDPEDRRCGKSARGERAGQGQAVDFDHHQLQASAVEHLLQRLQQTVAASPHQHAHLIDRPRHRLERLEIQREVLQWKRKQALGLGQQLRLHLAVGQSRRQPMYLADHLRAR